MKYKLTFDKNISRWDEGIPLGNGRMGGLIWGDGKELYVSLDRVDIWDRTTPFGIERPEFTYQTLVALAKEKNTAKIREIFDAPYDYPVPTKLPVGRIVLSFGQQIKTKSELCMEDAQAKMQVESGGRALVVHAFFSAAENIGVMSINEREEEKETKSGASVRRKNNTFPEVSLKPPGFGAEKNAVPYRLHKEISKGDLSELNYEPAVPGERVISRGRKLLFFSQKAEGNFSYGVVLGIRKEGKQTLLYFRVAASTDARDWLSAACREVEAYMEQEPEVLFAAHRQWWERYWSKSSLTLPDKQFELQWYLTNYLFASCSREGGYPMPLQGVWTAAEDKLPPWKGDYHNDLNTQMSYYHYLKANHLEEGRCFIDFLWNCREAGRVFAAHFYGTRGQCLPAVMTIDAKPLGGWPMYSLSPTNQIWLCHAFAEYFRYTGDKAFLSGRAYPYLKETAECIADLLTEGEDGKLYLPISSSPEIHDDTAEAFVKPNSNYDLALMHFLFETLAEYADLLGNGEAPGWRKIRAALPELSVSEGHVLMISPEEILAESHRHFSNAMAIHPLRLIPYSGDENRRIIDATIADFERLGTSQWVGFSFCWMAELYAVQKNGEKAWKMLSIFWNYFCSPNGFHLNGDYKKGGYSDFTYRPFTLEANMCAADALQEMLLFMKNHTIEPFPAIPAAWEKGHVSFERLRGENGILISAKLADGRLKSLNIEADREDVFKITGWTKEGIRSSGSSFCVKRGLTLFDAQAE